MIRYGQRECIKLLLIIHFVATWMKWNWVPCGYILWNFSFWLGELYKYIRLIDFCSIVVKAQWWRHASSGFVLDERSFFANCQSFPVKTIYSSFTGNPTSSLFNEHDLVTQKHDFQVIWFFLLFPLFRYSKILVKNRIWTYENFYVKKNKFKVDKQLRL